MNAKVLRSKIANRLRRKRSIRAKISGSESLPRVSIFRSNRFLSVQAINDESGVTLASANTKKIGKSANKDSASELGRVFADELKKAGISNIVFDRNGYKYHGVIAAFGDALRQNEIKF
ncbi:MAG: 50S ribosomal protein L18 [Sulfurimonas sp.]|jgi:large subunit ribosomal protein L18|nr:50S ribosomal protein L18 [Sulfurimonadaceae bacterium]